MTKTAWLFPGQGAQAVGMGKDLHDAFGAARKAFDQAEAASGLPLKKLCFEGPESDLARTDICQPAILTVSAAVHAVLNDLLSPDQLRSIEPAFLAGLSLGEYTALLAAGSMDLSTAVGLVARRGQLMQEAADAKPSGMVSLIGADAAKAQELCQAAAKGQILVCANFNCPGQIVLSGDRDACNRAAEMAKDFGASGAVSLKVAGAFHSPIMQPAAEKLSQAMEAAHIGVPAIPVISNVDALPHGDSAAIRRKLLAQLVQPVRWQQCVEYMLAQGVTRFLEIGPGRVLAGMMRRIDRKAEVVCLNSREAVEKLIGKA